MARGQLRGVAGHTYLVAKNLLVLFLKLVEKMKVCNLFGQPLCFILILNALGEDSARR